MKSTKKDAGHVGFLTQLNGEFKVGNSAIGVKTAVSFLHTQSPPFLGQIDFHGFESGCWREELWNNFLWKADIQVERLRDFLMVI